MEKVKLIEICSPKQWKTLATSELKNNGKYSVYGANGIIGYYDEYNHEKETVLITCRGATCGNVHISKEKSYINGNAMALDNLNEKVCLKEYLYYFLKQYDMKKVISGSAQPQITVQSLKRIEVKITNKDTQIKIVKELNEIQQIIDVRKKQIEELEKLIKSQFAEMFDNNEWNEVKLNDVSKKITDGEHGTVPRVENGRLYLMARNITDSNKIDLTETSYIPEENHKKIYKRCNPEKDDLLLVCVGATVGKAVLVPEMEEFSMARSVALIKPNKQLINSSFLLYLIKSDYIQLQIKNCVHAAAQAGLYTNMIKDLKFRLPPIELQIFKNS